jgi:hypothetical protein
MRVLAGPSRLQGARSQAGKRTGDNRCPLEQMRRGTSSACAKRTHSSRRRLISASTDEDTSFTRSRDPCTSIVTESSAGVVQAKPGECDAAVEISRSGKPTQVGATGTGVLVDGRMRGSPRVTARVTEVVRDA